jgi:Xaa-Pro aminopeptidase
MLMSQVPSYFKKRRDLLMKNNPEAVFILPSADEVYRNSDVAYSFRQESNFYYLTGFEEPESYLVLTPINSTSYKTVMFVRTRDPDREMWDGERYGVEGAKKIFHADETYPVHEFEKILPELLKGSDKIYYRVGQKPQMDQMIFNLMEVHRKSLGRSGKSLTPVADPNEILGEMRMFKSQDEIDLLKKAGEISAAAHKTAIQQAKPGMYEFEIEALVNFEMRRLGCQRLGYESIVAAGKNAACLHYRFNNEKLKDGDMLLVDAGGEFSYFTADITRTYPIGKQFSKNHKTFYELVLKSQLAAIQMAKPGAKLPDIHKTASLVLIEGCLSMGILKGKAEDIFKSNDYRRVYPHNTSHWLGMDVHDAGLYTRNGEPRALEPGMVFTIEPGFYIQPGDQELSSKYGVFGIRIEDDILITQDGHENLTKLAPKTVDDIEKLK